MTKGNRSWIQLILLGFLTASCASQRSAQVGEAAPEATSSGMPALHRAPLTNEKVRDQDVNRDGKADLFAYVLAVDQGNATSGERMVRKELDINWDGRVDMAQLFDDRGQVEREIFDLDFDGKVDQVNSYEQGVLVRKERDLDNSGKTNEWIFYEKGKIVRKERDTNADGRVDYWEYWEAEQIARAGEDLDGDGKVDRWTRSGATADAAEK
jgi:hypothetical protein